MLAHPYETLSIRTLRAATVGAASAWAVLTVILVWTVPVAHVAEVQRLLEATGTPARSAILESWSPSIVASLCFLLGFDFLYDVVHNNAVALFAVWGAVRRDIGFARSLAGLTAWVLWLDTGLNVVENLAFLHVLRSRSPQSLLPVVSVIFSFRSATMLLGVLVGLGLHVSASYGPRRTIR